MGETLACPECDSVQLREKTGRHDGVSGTACNDCGAVFDDAVRREPKREAGRHGHSKVLVEADPDDLDALLDGGRREE